MGKDQASGRGHHLSRVFPYFIEDVGCVPRAVAELFRIAMRGTDMPEAQEEWASGNGVQFRLGDRVIEMKEAVMTRAGGI